MIYYFGDSNTAEEGEVPSPNENKWHHVPYSKYLTDLLGIKFKNFAWGGKNFMLNVIDLIKNLEDIEKNASIILFQIQFICNPILKYEDIDFTSKDIIFTSVNLNQNEVYENEELEITKDDSLTILNWSYKFEERRSLYDLDIVFHIFEYLKTKGIKCYLLYWARPFDVKLPINEFVLKFDNNNIYALNIDVYYPKTYIDLTKGEWKDYHTISKFNENLANKIYNQIISA